MKAKPSTEDQIECVVERLYQSIPINTVFTFEELTDKAAEQLSGISCSHVSHYIDSCRNAAIGRGELKTHPRPYGPGNSPLPRPFTKLV